MTFGLSLSLVLGTACTDDGGPGDNVGDGDSGDEQSSADTTGDTGSGTDTGDTGSETGDTGSDTDDPGPTWCEWSNFPSQYGIALSLGQKCGELGWDATQEDIDAVLACLEAAFEADEAAWAAIDWSDGGDNTHRLRWYVRPIDSEGPGSPRRIETKYFRQYVEEGPTPEGDLDVYTCSDFVKSCDDFPGRECTACVQPKAKSCVVDP